MPNSYEIITSVVIKCRILEEFSQRFSPTGSWSFSCFLSKQCEKDRGFNEQYPTRLHSKSHFSAQIRTWVLLLVYKMIFPPVSLHPISILRSGNVPGGAQSNRQDIVQNDKKMKMN